MSVCGQASRYVGKIVDVNRDTGLEPGETNCLRVSPGLSPSDGI